MKGEDIMSKLSTVTMSDRILLDGASGDGGEKEVS